MKMKCQFFKAQKNRDQNKQQARKVCISQMKVILKKDSSKTFIQPQGIVAFFFWHFDQFY